MEGVPWDCDTLVCIETSGGISSKLVLGNSLAVLPLATSLLY